MSLREMEIGLWYAVIGYYFFLFIYFLMRYRTSKKIIHTGFSLFFVTLAIGRALFLVYDFYYTGDLLFWKLGTVFQWVALSSISAAISTLIFQDKNRQTAFIIIPLIVATVVAVLPPDLLLPQQIPRIVINNVVAPIYAILIPVLFFYVARRSAGLIRKSAFLIGLGFLTFYVGRVIHSEILKTIFGFTVGVIAPSLVIVALVLIAAGVQYGLLY
ncbi:MAG: hypothetical protein ACFE7E_00070 [Candidatus Hodarchaeota archaeon]